MSNALADAIQRYTDAQPGKSPYVTALPGLTALRASRPQPPAHRIFKPALCIVAQGAKSAVFGGRRLDYRAGQALIVSLEMPALGWVMQASTENPFLGLIVEFDLAIMREVFEGLDAPPKLGGNIGGSAAVNDFDGPLADCALRLIRLLDTPDAIPILYPSIMRELSYWLLTGPAGGDVIKIALAGNHEQRVVSAIHALRNRFAEPMRIEALAQLAQMSASAFHRQFKAITSMSPLQYQKRLRLLEARRLMMSEAANVETAAFGVGYESPSQFSREYARMFGAPPRRDVAGLATLAGNDESARLSKRVRRFAASARPAAVS